MCILSPINGPLPRKTISRQPILNILFAFGKKKLTLQAKGAETGRSKVEMPIDYEGKPISISFDPKFVGDMLKVLEPDAPLTLELTDGSAPAATRRGRASWWPPTMGCRRPGGGRSSSRRGPGP